jgi:hypothetical protein
VASKSKKERRLVDGQSAIREDVIVQLRLWAVELAPTESSEAWKLRHWSARSSGGSHFRCLAEQQDGLT